MFGIAGKDGCIEGWALTGNDGQCSIGSGLNCSTWAVLLAKLTLKRKKVDCFIFFSTNLREF